MTRSVAPPHRTADAVPRAARPDPVGGSRRRGRTPAESARSYERVALVLQGGGALGSYQAGVFEALDEAGIHPDWLAGISIGAINAAIIAGNPPGSRVAGLREFWRTVTRSASPAGWPIAGFNNALAFLPPSDGLSRWFAASGAVGALTQGQQGFFSPRPLPPWLLNDGSAAATSFYDASALRTTLERIVDFDRINSGATRLSVGAVNVHNGNVVYFDSAKMPLRADHIIASGALPPAFAAVDIDGELYWDGGVVSNTPLQYVLSDEPRRDTLALQVDLWSARGDLPANIFDVLERQKDIQYSSRTRMATDTVARLQKLRAGLTELLGRVDPDTLPAGLIDDLRPWTCDRVFNVIHLIYRSKPHEEQYKDYSFAPTAIDEHWQAGVDDMRRTLAHAPYFDKPSREAGMVTHDVHRDEFPNPRVRR